MALPPVEVIEGRTSVEPFAREVFEACVEYSNYLFEQLDAGKLTRATDGEIVFVDGVCSEPDVGVRRKVPVTNVARAPWILMRGACGLEPVTPEGLVAAFECAIGYATCDFVPLLWQGGDVLRILVEVPGVRR
jgi:hypothetical protein